MSMLELLEKQISIKILLLMSRANNRHNDELQQITYKQIDTLLKKESYLYLSAYFSVTWLI